MKIGSILGHRELNTKVKTTASALSDTMKETWNNVPKKAKTSALVAFFLLPAMGTVSSCKSEKDPEKIVIVDKPVDTKKQNKYLDKTDSAFYVVKKGDNPGKIAEKFNVSTMRLLAQNGMDEKKLIHAGDTLVIPESYNVKNVKDFEDVAELTGLSEEFINDLIKMEGVHDTIYVDRNGHKTIGVGHVLSLSEAKEFENKTVSKSQIATWLAQDLLERDLNIKTMMSEDSYSSIHSHLKESVLDLVFNKGEKALSENKDLIEGLREKDYVKAVSHLTQDYSIVINAKGEKVKRPASGLSKRRLYDIKNASQIFKNGMPKAVLNSAEKVYKDGLVYMKNEADKGQISKAAYPNVLEEYKKLAYEWFDGKIGELPKSERKVKAENVQGSKKTVDSKKLSGKGSNQKIYINGEPTGWTVKSLYADWKKTADRSKRAFKRPLPEVDKNGNLTATVKVLQKPNSKGFFKNKTIIINPGHGGAMGVDGNVNFDPGTSNAVMSSKNKNVETNVFRGNGGKSLEEWVVNKKIADVIAEQIVNEGGKVIYIQGSVYNAMKAIRKIQKENKVNLVVSLHSNSDGDKRGIYVIANKRDGVIDEEDKKFAKIVTDKMNEHSWFRGITHQTEQSLGVLSSSAKASSPVPGILIETGNLKNETDVANLNSRTFKEQMIESILAGMKEYLK